MYKANYKRKFYIRNVVFFRLKMYNNNNNTENLLSPSTSPNKYAMLLQYTKIL